MSVFRKQVYIRLSEDGKSFFYTVKYGRFSKAARETRLVDPAGDSDVEETADAPISCPVLPQPRVADSCHRKE